jgi:hypothetical protein
MTLFSKAIKEALSLQNADLEILREKRGKKFLIKDAKLYVKVVERMNPEGDQSGVVFSLHKNSVKSHYEILDELSLSNSIAYRDEPYTEHFQTPVLLEILYEKDPEFREFVERFIQEISIAESIILRESRMKYYGFYGPTCALDFALTPGSTGNVLNQILRRMKLSGRGGEGEKEHYYARTLLASKSFGINTSYGFGWKFLNAIKEGKTEKEAVKEEANMLKLIFSCPIKAQQQLMQEVKFLSFNPEDYLREYKRRMRKTVEKAIDEEVHYGNILSVPAYAVGDIGHHLSQSIYDLCKDDLAFAILEGIVDVTESTLKKKANYENLNQVLSIATGSAAGVITYILESEGFNAKMVISLLMKKFQNFIQTHPYRGIALELHSVDFMDSIHRGDKILHEDKGKIFKTKIDFSPLKKRGIVRDPREWIYPNYAFNSRFSTLMKISDHFCLFNLEPMSVGILTNILSLKPEKLIAPIKTCKKCAVSFIMKERCKYCERKRMI